MQFAYQFPDTSSGSVLVASGGLGAEVSIVLRAATLPGAELSCRCSRSAGRAAPARRSAAARRARAAPRRRHREIARGFASLADPEAPRGLPPHGRARSSTRRPARRAPATASTSPSGADADRLGRARPRSSRSRTAAGPHEAMPGSRLDVFEDAGHFPHLDRPLPLPGADQVRQGDEAGTPGQTKEIRDLAGRTPRPGRPDGRGGAPGAQRNAFMRRARAPK